MTNPQDWTTAGAFTVAAGVHRIPLPLPQDGLRAVNVYALEAEDGLVLIDAGWALDRSRAALERALASIGAGLGDIRRFLVTHAHRDHYTQAVAIRRELGTTVSIGIGEQPTFEALETMGDRPFAPQLAQLRRAGAQRVIEALIAGVGGEVARVSRSDWEPPDDWIEPRARLAVADRTLTALPTPGHTRGHVVFVDADAGLLFAGDHVLPHITPSIGFEAVPAEQPLRDYLSSLRVVRELPDLALLPAHGPPAASVHARIDALLAHHDERLGACLGAVRAGAGTAYEIARVLRWTRRHRHFDDLDPFNQMLAVTETLAHVDLLALQGRLARDEVDGVRVYELPAA